MLNLTPHAIGVADADGVTIATLPASGMVARVASRDVPAGVVVVAGAEVPVVTTVYGDVEGVPAAGTETFVVSAMVLAQLGQEYRGWAFAPDTGKTAVRNESGQVVAVRNFRTV